VALLVPWANHPWLCLFYRWGLLYHSLSGLGPPYVVHFLSLGLHLCPCCLGSLPSQFTHIIGQFSLGVGTKYQVWVLSAYYRARISGLGSLSSLSGSNIRFGFSLSFGLNISMGGFYFFCLVYVIFGYICCVIYIQ